MKIKYACNCEERKKQAINRRWVCTQYKWNNGSFVVDGGEYSNYSTVRCLMCGSITRTKAKYVGSLKQVKSAVANHLEAQIKNNSEAQQPLTVLGLLEKYGYEEQKTPDSLITCI